jgi:hypothetical protein
MQFLGYGENVKYPVPFVEYGERNGNIMYRYETRNNTEERRERDSGTEELE